MAQTALLTLDAVNAATARAWLKDGHQVFVEILDRLLGMAGLKKPAVTPRTDDAAANRRALYDRLRQMGAGQSSR